MKALSVKHCFAILIQLLLLTNLYAQPGRIDTSFNPTDVGFNINHAANGTINALVLQSDGKIFIGGFFTNYNGTPINRIARLNINGSLDTSFNLGTGANGVIRSLALQSDGQILIGGDFTGYNDIAIERIARLNADGSLDTSFNPGTGASGTISSIVLQPDGKILIGGNFISYNGTSRNRIARLNSDGSLDFTFNPGLGADNNIFSLALQLDGKILIVGNFTNYNGTSRNRIARLNSDGTIDPTFNPGTGANINIRTLYLQPDGKVLIGGGFTIFNGVSRFSIARINADGSLDPTFNPGTGANNTIWSLYLQSDGKTVIGGDFTSYNGTSRSQITRVNVDGSLDTTFNPGLGADNRSYSITSQADGKLLIGGSFNCYNSTARNHIARLNADGSLDNTFNSVIGTGANNVIWSITTQPNGRVLIGGDFTSYNGTSINRIARLDVDGDLDPSFNSGTGANSSIDVLALQPDGKVLIGGTFTIYNGAVRNYIARLNADGSLDTTFNPGTGADDIIYALVLQPDGKILIGGFFTSYNGTPRNRIARLNADGSLDMAFNPGTGASSQVNSIILQPDGKMLIGGAFTNYNGIPINRIARLNGDGSLDPTFNPGTGANGTIWSLVLQPDGKVLIGGSGLSNYNGTAVNNIARVNPNGDLDNTFNTGSGVDNIVWALALQLDGKVLVGGNFTNYNGTARNRIARLNADGSLDINFDTETGADLSVLVIILQPNEKILIGGSFTSYSNVGRNRIARIFVADAVAQIDIKDNGNATPSGSNINFPITGVGSSQLKELEITNTGTAPLIITDIQLTGDFSLASALPPPIDPGNSAILSINFAPTNLGQRTGTLTILSNGDIAVYTINLLGEGDAEPEVYNVVTPNPNGKHDFLNIRNITLFPNNRVTIYDRWGNKVFEKDNYDNVTNPFTGKSDGGKDLPDGTYYYVIDKNNGTSRITGFLLLRR